MSSTAHQIPVASLVSNSGSFARIPSEQDNLQRDAGLRIRWDKQSDQFWLSPSGPLFPPPQDWTAPIPLSRQELFGYTQDCLGEWQKRIVDYVEVTAHAVTGQSKSWPFRDRWDLSERHDAWVRSLCAPLASAGQRLFRQIFERTEDPQLQTFAERLVSASRDRPLTLTVTAEHFYTPWGLLYTHPNPAEPLDPDGSNFLWNGFWGFRHIVEHSPEWVELDNAVLPTRDGLVLASINIDEGIQPRLTFLGTLRRLGQTVRRSKSELRSALTALDQFTDQIVYFYCHGECAGQPTAPSTGRAWIKLTDGEEITEADVEDWLNKRKLPSHPIVFINACQGGQMTTVFYETLAARFLKAHAACLIGAQVYIPAVFAAEYAKRFFTRFLDDGRVRVGPLMRELAGEFVSDHNNPLGLVYSLYRGADCFVSWPDAV